MNTTSKASNAFEAFFGIHELPPSPSPPTSPLLLLSPPPPRVLTSTLRARKLHWRNPTANIGIDIIGIRISQQRHGEHNTDEGVGAHETHTQPFGLADQSLADLFNVAAVEFAGSSLSIHTSMCTQSGTRRPLYVHTTLSNVAAGVPSPHGRIRP